MSRYPKDWPDIAARVKVVAGWQCEACGVDHGAAEDGEILTVHHLDGNQRNPPSMPHLIPHPNLIALCQICHLRAEVWTRRGAVLTREQTIERLRRIIAEERAQQPLFGS